MVYESILPVANAIWIGPHLGPLQAACLRSFVRCGHKVVLHCYAVPTNVPEGIELCDARALIPEDEVFRHTDTGSYAPFADLLRYEILGAGLGLYVDCDVYCLRPIEDQDRILGWASDKVINNAVLKLPADCQVLRKLRRFRKMEKAELQVLPWGATGPRALTRLAHRHGLAAHASPVDVFSPVHWADIGSLATPGITLSDVITPRTVAIHLYSATLATIDGLTDFGDVAPSSALGMILAS